MEPPTIVSYIKQSIEILLMMKDEEYEDIISKEKKKSQRLASILEKRKTPKPPEDNYIQMIKNKISEVKRFRFDKEYLDISTFDAYSEISCSVDNPSLGRHKDNCKRFIMDTGDTPSSISSAQGNSEIKVRF